MAHRNQPNNPHKDPRERNEGASLPIWVSMPSTVFHDWPQGRIGGELLEVAKTLNWKALSRKALMIYDYPVGSPERESIGVALSLATWYINDRTGRMFYGGQEAFLYAPATPGGVFKHKTLAAAAKARKNRRRVAA